MFEKEAEERAEKLEEKQTLGIYDNDEDLARDERFNEGQVVGYEEGFKDGAEFGYNKANEWHYVKDGLPKDNEYVLIYTNLNNCYVATKVKNHFMSKGWGFIPMSTVIAWKEIVLPELKESE